MKSPMLPFGRTPAVMGILVNYWAKVGLSAHGAAKHLARIDDASTRHGTCKLFSAVEPFHRWR